MYTIPDIRKSNILRIIFLDFDGVLNSHSGWRSRGFLPENPSREQIEDRDICSENILMLNSIIEQTSAKIVVSSTWRLDRPIHNLQSILSRNGCIGEVIGSTPELFVDNQRAPRGLEIQAWLDFVFTESSIKNVSFVILDDDVDMAHLRNKLVKTSLFTGGLQSHHIAEAIKILEDQENEQHASSSLQSDG